jgi:hypothetical protein
LHLTFLNPVPALIAAAITVPALLLLYFLKLRRRPVRVSSTLLWQQATRDLQVNVPFRFIRPTWLLFLQLLILALFLLALARPAVNMTAGTPERVVLIIDRSASMNARDGSGGPTLRSGSGIDTTTRLDEARDRAGRMLDELSRSSPGSSFAIVELAAAPRVVAGLSHDTAASRSALNTVQPSDQPGDLADALRLAGAMLTGEATEASRDRPGQVILFSDGDFPPAAEGFTLAGPEFRYQRVGPLDSPAGAHAHPRDNLGIVALAAQRDWTDPAVVRLFVRVRNAGSGPVATPLVLSINGQEVERKPLVVPGTSGHAAPPGPELTPPDATDPAPPANPAEAAATFSLTRRDGGVVTVSIDRSDLLDADNAASLILDPATKPRILVVVPNPPSPPAEVEAGKPVTMPRSPEWLITDVIRELKLPMRVIPASAYERDAAEPGISLNAELVIFDRVAPTHTPAAPSISFGAGLAPDGLALQPPGANATGTYVVSWQRSHPVLQHVALDAVFISRPMSPARAATDRPTITELARGSTGPLILLQEDRSARRVVVCFDLAYSNWPLTAGFPIFLAQAIDFLTLRAEERAGRAFTTAEPVEIDVAPGTTHVTLTGPQRLERTVGEGDPTPAGLRRVSLGLLDRAGVYRVEGGGVKPADDPASPTAAVAVNLLDATESSIAVAERLRVAGVAVPGSGPGEEPAELWPYLIAAALILLTLEWFLNAFLMKV